MAQPNLGTGGRVIIITAALIVVCAGLRAAAPLVLPLLLATIVAVATMPLVHLLRRRGVPSGPAIGLAIAIDIGALAGISLLVVHTAQVFAKKMPQYRQRMREIVIDAVEWLRGLGMDLSGDDVSSLIQPDALMSGVAQLLQGLTGIASNTALVFVIVAFMLLEGADLGRKLGRALGRPAPERFERIGNEVKKYLLVKTAISAATGLLIGGWTWILGLDLPVLWGLLAFLLNYIPTIGSFIAAIPALALALLQSGLGLAVGVGAGFLVVNLVMGSFLEPRLAGRALGLSPLVVFCSMMFWGWLLGPVGAVLSAPLAVVTKIAFANTEDLSWIAVMMGTGKEAAGEAADGQEEAGQEEAG